MKPHSLRMMAWWSLTSQGIIHNSEAHRLWETAHWSALGWLHHITARKCLGITTHTSMQRSILSMNSRQVQQIWWWNMPPGNINFSEVSFYWSSTNYFLHKWTPKQDHLHVNAMTCTRNWVSTVLVKLISSSSLGGSLHGIEYHKQPKW